MSAEEKLPPHRPGLRNQLLTWANLVTTVRLIAGFIAFAIAFIRADETWLFIGLAIYWALDVFDGFIARLLDQETLFGAQYDILVDRVQVCFFYLIYCMLHPESLVVVILFLSQFMVFDHYLSNQFMRYDIISPNYFYKVDQKIFDLLWSKLGKATNTGLVTILLVVSPTIWLPFGVTVALIGLRIYCIARLLSLPEPAHMAEAPS